MHPYLKMLYRRLGKLKRFDDNQESIERTKSKIKLLESTPVSEWPTRDVSHDDED